MASAKKAAAKKQAGLKTAATNRAAAQAAAASKAPVEAKWIKSHGTGDDCYIGHVKAIHIHLVRANTHVQVGKERHNFDPNNDAAARAARTWLERSGGRGKPGYEDCHAWLGQPRAKRV